MKITIELVIAFFEDRCSAEEAEAVHRYLEENPGLLHDFFPEEEWMTFQATEGLPETWSQKTWKKIRKEKAPVRPLYIMIRAAAAIAVVAVGFLVFKHYAAGKADPGVKLARSLPAAENGDTILVNQTDKIRKDTLTDGSVVELSPAGRLRLRWGFEDNKRSIALSGEALFDVAPDAHRPFIVVTRGFTTTVLGTIFRIKAYPDSNKASIRLLKGRVMVRSTFDKAQSVSLVEGQECTFDNRREDLSARAPEKRPAQMAASPADSSLEITGWDIQFKHLPLPRVLTILSETYHTPIQFTNADLRGRNFTGSIQKDQSLDDALNTIAQLNDLLVTRQDSSYRITLRR